MMVVMMVYVIRFLGNPLRYLHENSWRCKRDQGGCRNILIFFDFHLKKNLWGKTDFRVLGTIGHFEVFAFWRFKKLVHPSYVTLGKLCFGGSTKKRHKSKHEYQIHMRTGWPKNSTGWHKNGYTC